MHQGRRDGRFYRPSLLSNPHSLAPFSLNAAKNAADASKGRLKSRDSRRSLFIGWLSFSFSGYFISPTLFFLFPTSSSSSSFSCLLSLRSLPSSTPAMVFQRRFGTCRAVLQTNNTEKHWFPQRENLARLYLTWTRCNVISTFPREYRRFIEEYRYFPCANFLSNL